MSNLLKFKDEAGAHPYRDIIQGSEEWHELRRGKITASSVHKINSKAQRLSYLCQKISEQLEISPEASEEINTKAMQWGKDYEPVAGAVYSASSLKMMEPYGFKVHPQYDFIGASPDLVEVENGRIVSGAEIKCPFNSSNHIRHLFGDLKTIMPQYYMQVQLTMACFDVDRWTFISYDPRLKKGGMIEQIIYADTEYQSGIIDNCKLFYEDMETKLKEIEDELCS